MHRAVFLCFTFSAHVFEGDFGHNYYGCCFWLLNFFRRDGPFAVNGLYDFFLCSCRLDLIYVVGRFSF
jgi:hypothetical protein